VYHSSTGGLLAQVAAKLGRVIVGLLTDEAIRTYKRQTIISWEDRKKVVDAFVGVAEVVPQYTLDYSDNLKKYRPHYVVHVRALSFCCWFLSCWMCL